ncbi:unnamed protein product [Phytophthora lilii]|uniref:Unnamed protein product n=1 Tax=Phytophthora lilii TaxID=2077276 RepID=A0A9W6TCC5_9STRA|nr:unnamed protein product [Phytophthora lilii]
MFWSPGIKTVQISWSTRYRQGDATLSAKTSTINSSKAIGAYAWVRMTPAVDPKGRYKLLCSFLSFISRYMWQKWLDLIMIDTFSIYKTKSTESKDAAKVHPWSFLGDTFAKRGKLESELTEAFSGCLSQVLDTQEMSHDLICWVLGSAKFSLIVRAGSDAPYCLLDNPYCTIFVADHTRHNLRQTLMILPSDNYGRKAA